MSRLISFLKSNQIIITILLTLVVAVKVVMLDQLAKTSVATYFDHHSQSISVTSFLNIVLIYNKGISFGFLHNIDHVNLILTGLVIMIVIFLWFWFLKNISLFNILPIGWITGGAIGNLIDRFTRSGVLDFIDFHYKGMHYPAFNIADGAIVCGAIILLIGNIFSNKSKNDIKYKVIG